MVSEVLQPNGCKIISQIDNNLSCLRMLNLTMQISHVVCLKGLYWAHLLFLLYVNDIANVSKLLFPILFADDTNVFFSGKNIDQMINIMNDELDRLFLWLNSNKLSLNVKKTQFVVFSLKKHITVNTDMCINNQIIYRIEHITLLGVI